MPFNVVSEGRCRVDADPGGMSPLTRSAAGLWQYMATTGGEKIRHDIKYCAESRPDTTRNVHFGASVNRYASHAKDVRFLALNAYYRTYLVCS